MDGKPGETEARGVWAQLTLPNGLMVWVILRPGFWTDRPKNPYRWNIEPRSDVEDEGIRSYYNLGMTHEAEEVAQMRDRTTERIKARRRARERGYWPY